MTAVTGIRCMHQKQCFKNTDNHLIQKYNSTVTIKRQVIIQHHHVQHKQYMYLVYFMKLDLAQFQTAFCLKIF